MSLPAFERRLLLLGSPAEIGQVEWVVRRANFLPVADAWLFLVCSQDPDTRRELWAKALREGKTPGRVVDPSAVLADDVQVGEGSVVMPGVVVNAAGRVGVNCWIGIGATLDHDAQLGDHVVVGAGCHAAGTVQLESGSRLGLGVALIPGRRVGPGGRVCSGSTVTRDVPAGAVVAGTPAREESEGFW